MLSRTFRWLALLLILGGLVLWRQLGAPRAVDAAAARSRVAAPAPATLAPAESAPLAATVPPAAPAPDVDAAIVGEWTGRPATPLIAFARAQARENAPPTRTIPIRLANDRTGTVLVDHYEPTGEDEGVFSGILDGYPGSTVVLSYVGDAQAGVVLLPGEHRSFTIRGGDDGVIHVTELDTRLAPGCASEKG